MNEKRFVTRTSALLGLVAQKLHLRADVLFRMLTS